MPWYEDVTLSVSYKEKMVHVGKLELPVLHRYGAAPKVEPMSVKKFRCILQRKGLDKADYVVYKLCNVESKPKGAGASDENQNEDPEANRIWEDFLDVFTEEFPSELRPKRSVGHRIDTEPSSEPPHRPLFHLSPAELVTTKDYVTSLLESKKKNQVLHLTALLYLL